MPLSDPKASEGDGTGTNTRGPAPLLPARLRGCELLLLRWPPRGTAPSLCRAHRGGWLSRWASQLPQALWKETSDLHSFAYGCLLDQLKCENYDIFHEKWLIFSPADSAVACE